MRPIPAFVAIAGSDLAEGQSIYIRKECESAHLQVLLRVAPQKKVCEYSLELAKQSASLGGGV